jgi:TPR repeat protein
MGNCYNYGHGVTQDYKKAAEWYEKAADQGSDNAKKTLNFLKEEGKI